MELIIHTKHQSDPLPLPSPYSLLWILYKTIFRKRHPLPRKHLHLSLSLRICLATNTPLSVEPANEEITGNDTMARDKRGEWVVPQCASYRARGPLAQGDRYILVCGHFTTRNGAHVVVYCPLVGRYALDRDARFASLLWMRLELRARTLPVFVLKEVRSELVSGYTTLPT